MKKASVYISLLFGLLPLLISAQTDTKGSIITASNEVLAGDIKDQLQKKGNILFTNASGNKKLYSPADLSEFSINGIRYVSYANDFYKVVTTGNKAILYIRVTDNSGKLLYNGAEMVTLSTAEGKVGDYYFQLKSDSKLNWVPKKNFNDVMTGLSKDCSSVVASIQSGQLDYTQIVKLVEQYNSCQ
ncbi:MAG: hypothetical protein IBJ16_12820 [Chitinophagaceae bacterium]|nr:hypothetical protein [Chitinophagaceae bacterium]